MGSWKKVLSGPWIVRLVLAVLAGVSAWYGLALRGSLGFFVDAAQNHASKHLPGDPSKLGFVAWGMSSLTSLFGNGLLVVAVLFLVLAAIPWGWSPRRRVR